MQININCFDKNKLALEETLMHTANGYLGGRANIVDKSFNDYSRGFYINGFYEEGPINYGEKFHGYPSTKQAIINLPDLQTIRLFIDGTEIKIASCEILNYQHNLNMEQGVVTRRFGLKTSDNKELEIKTTRLASFEIKNLFVLQYEVKFFNFNAELKLNSSLDCNVQNFADPSDPRLAAHAEKPLQLLSLNSENGYINAQFKAKNSGLKLYVSLKHDCSSKPNIETNKLEAIESFTTNLKQGETFQLTKYCLFTDSYHYNDAKNEMQNCKTALQNTSYAQLLSLQEQYLNKFWSVSRINISDKHNVQNSLNYSLYSLLCSLGSDVKFPISAKGLSGEGYEGHVFWDSEAYVAPFFIINHPELAKTMLLYRYNILSYAKQQAKELGHSKGALFAWRSIQGGECSAYYPAGSAQYHINSDIAYAFMQYWYASHDYSFLEACFELLLETSRLWMDMGHYTPKGFCLDMVTGPDEYTCLVNNNFYTNCGARFNMLACLEIYNELKAYNSKSKTLQLCNTNELNEILKAAENMYIPYDEALDINPQDDSFLNKKALNIKAIDKSKFPLLLHYHPLYLYRHQVCKQADVVLAHVLHKSSANLSTKIKSFKYYEAISTHDSSLSLCAYAIMAAQIGFIDEAEDYFVKTVELDLKNTHHNTKDGIHTANMGGAHLIITKGFAGMYMDSKGLSLNPVRLNSIDAYDFNISYRGNIINVYADKQSFKISLIKGENVDIVVKNQSISLKADKAFVGGYC